MALFVGKSFEVIALNLPSQMKLFLGNLPLNFPCHPALVIFYDYFIHHALIHSVLREIYDRFSRYLDFWGRLELEKGLANGLKRAHGNSKNIKK